MKKTILVALFGATLLYAENSAFGAGDLTSDTPYGLTLNEKLFKEKLETLNDSYLQNTAKINQTNERLEGLQSTLEGINSQYSKSNSRLNQLEKNFEFMDKNLTKQIDEIRAYIQENRKIQDANNKQIKKILAELSSLVDSININYVSKSEFDQKFITKSLKTNENNSSENNKTISNLTKENKANKELWKQYSGDELLSLAIKEFNDNFFEEAKLKFQHLIEKHYKPARANFYLGEIEYKQENYNNAIIFYKKSSAISTKGDYFPKLLYHTAISLDKIGEPKNANGFYQALKTNYPNSPEAKASPNRK